MKRVIGWDLWGTLIHSTYTGETYEDYLSRYVDRTKVQATVRAVLMTGEACRDPDGMCAAADDRPLTYEECYHILYKRLFISSGPFHDLFMEELRGWPDPNKVTKLWQMENEAAEWMPWARETLQQMQSESTDDKHLLVTNTTAPGWKTVDKKLGITRAFKRGRSDLILSFHYPSAKPDPHIWTRVKHEHRDADEYWMIGDDPVIDLAVSAAMGWKTILVGKKRVPITAVPSIISGGNS